MEQKSDIFSMIFAPVFARELAIGPLTPCGTFLIGATLFQDA
jgi:hypothetical protein